LGSKEEKGNKESKSLSFTKKKKKKRKRIVSSMVDIGKVASLVC
jgi:hypothetical protein